ncbi:MAG TPA: hypothetical protein VES42_14595 [Pilimelia sp.]|nr:hypothetical protein [Pilimelia sp.]
MASRFSFTDEGLDNLRVYDVSPAEVWEALHSAHRVIRHLGDDVMVVYAAARRGRRLAVLLAEADHADNDWEVLSARDLTDIESKRYDEALAQRPGPPRWRRGGP